MRIERLEPIIVGLLLTSLPLTAMAQQGGASKGRWEAMVERFDADEDRSVTRSEFPGSDARFDRLDSNQDGKLDAEDAKARRSMMRSQNAGRGSGSMLSMRHGSDQSPAVGDVAPDFTLKRLNSEETVTLSELYSDRPVVLTLGSYTCPPFREAIEGIEQIFQQYKDDYAFCFVYIKEAHATDERPVGMNARRGINFVQPTTYEGRETIATTCQSQIHLTMPILVDTLDNAVERLYAGAPNRTYLIDRGGMVLYKGLRGPKGTKPDEVVQAIKDRLEGVGAKGIAPTTERRVP